MSEGGCRVMGQCQAAVAEAVEVFGNLDILLCCSSEGWGLHGILESSRCVLIIYYSAGRHGRRARGFSTDTDACTRTV